VASKKIEKQMTSPVSTPVTTAVTSLWVQLIPFDFNALRFRSTLTGRSSLSGGARIVFVSYSIQRSIYRDIDEALQAALILVTRRTSKMLCAEPAQFAAFEAITEAGQLDFPSFVTNRA
jgi:hypothetical protein